MLSRTTTALARGIACKARSSTTTLAAFSCSLTASPTPAHAPRLVGIALPSSRRVLSTTPSRLSSQSPMAAPTDKAAQDTQSTTGITPDTLTLTLKNSPQLNPSHVDIQDISGGCGASFAALIVSDAFEGKSALQRHRLVNGILKDEIRAIHAWTPRCLTAKQWEEAKAKEGQ